VINFATPIFFWAMGLHREEKAHKIPAQQNERKKFKNQN